eukprot:SAG31_NODE_3820_length_3852_cov_4.934985_2_plen_112_part_00
MVMMELDALATLADIVGRPEGAQLRARSAKLKKLVQHLWDEEYGVFVSRFATGACPENTTLCDNEYGFYRRISPTSVWPMLSGAATQAQAGRMMVEWLQNSSRFAQTRSST